MDKLSQELELVVFAKYIAMKIDRTIGPHRISMYLELNGFNITPSGVQWRFKLLRRRGFMDRDNITEKGVDCIQKRLLEYFNETLLFLVTKERYKGAICRTKLSLKILQYADGIPVSTRELGKILNLTNKTTLNCFEKFKKLDLIQKSGKIGWVLDEAGKLLSDKLDVKLDQRTILFLDNVKRKKFYYSKVLEDWKRIVENQDEESEDKMFFHWYDLPDGFKLKVNLAEFRNFLDEIKKDNGIKSDRQFALKMGYNEKLIRNYRNWVYKPSVKAYVFSSLQILLFY